MVTDAPNLNRLIYFTTVVEAGSFTAAGDQLGVAKAVVSHQIARLEEELGVTLLTRTTRRVTPTEEGLLFHGRAVAILRDAELAYAEMSRRAAEPSGHLRLTAPLDYGAAVVAPVIAAYRVRYQQVQVTVSFDDQVMDLAQVGVDVAIRAGWLADAANRARRLGAFEQWLVAAPHSVPPTAALTPQMVAGLPWIANAALRHPLKWTFTAPDDRTQQIEAEAAVTADKTPAALALVQAGAGIGVFPDYLVRGRVAQGQLQRLLPEWALPSGNIHAVYPLGRYRPARVRHFIDMLAAAERKRRD